MTQHHEPKLFTRDEFNAQVIGGKGAFIVDIWADWCQPCRMLAPYLHKMSAEFDGRVAVVKINYDDNRDLKEQYGFQGIPALLFFNDGELVAQSCGFGGYPYLRSSVDAFLAKVTGQATPEPTAAELAFCTAAAAAQTALEESEKPVRAALMVVYKRLSSNAARVGRRAKAAHASGRVDDNEVTRRTQAAKARVEAGLTPARATYIAGMQPLEAAYVAAIEQASGVFSSSGNSQPSDGHFCQIGDKTCTG